MLNLSQILFYVKIPVSIFDNACYNNCALILNNAKIMSKARIISVSGMIARDLNDDNNVFREVRKTMIKNFFSKEWIKHQKLVQAYEQVQEKNKALQEAYDKLLEENKLLKSADNRVAVAIHTPAS